MARHSEPRWSDAWLLLALIYASQKGPVDRGQISEAGDYINRAVFTDEEFCGGIARLKARGHVIEGEGRFRPSPGVLEWYRSSCPARGSVHRELKRVEDFLRVTRGA
jgi:hypothetical protein